MSDFIKNQFDKIMLVVLVVYFTIFMALLLLRFPNIDAGTLQWIEKSVDMAEGALIGAVTTAGVMRAKSNPDPTPPKEDK